MQNSAFKVGVFVTVSAAALGGIALFFGQIPIFKKEQVTYYAYFKDVGGLSIGADVRVAGVKVGKVEKMTFADGRVKVVLQIKKSVPIYKNAVAKIKSLGILGDKYVEIYPGNPSAGLLPPGSVIAKTLPPTDIGKMIDNISSAAEALRKLSQELNLLLAENRKNINRLTGQLALLSERLNEVVEENRKDFSRLVKNLALLSQSLNGELPPLLKRLNDIVTTLDKTLKETSPSVKNTFKNLAGLTRNLNSLAVELNKNRQALIRTLKNIEKITADIEKGRGTLGKLVKDKSLYRELKKSVSALGKAAELISKTSLHVEAFAQWEGTGDGKAGVNLIIQPDRSKYYLIGVVGDSAGKVTKTTYYYNGREEQVVEKQFKPEINLQYAKIFTDRWFHPGSSFVFRFGIKESTGGVGLDYVYNPRLMFTFDIWDFGREDRPGESLKPNTELGFKYYFKNGLFVRAGGYDLLNPTRTVFVGGGLSFTDNDLKYLLGGMGMPKF